MYRVLAQETLIDRLVTALVAADEPLELICRRINPTNDGSPINQYFITDNRLPAGQEVIGGPFDDPTDAIRAASRLVISALLEALREPSQEMLDEVCSDATHASIDAKDHVMRDVWRDMINVLIRGFRE